MKAPLRQGDILLVPVKKVPDGLHEIPREDGKIVLAEGEVSGHLHAIKAPGATFLTKDLGSPEDRYLVVDVIEEAERITAEAVELTHPEHDTVVLEPGAYEVRRQREYSKAGGIELVAD